MPDSVPAGRPPDSAPAQDPARISAPARSPGRHGAAQSASVPLRVAATRAPLPAIEGGFRTVLADPPWRFTNRTGKVAPEHRRLNRYDTLSLDEIKEIPVGLVSDNNSH